MRSGRYSCTFCGKTLLCKGPTQVQASVSGFLALGLAAAALMAAFNSSIALIFSKLGLKMSSRTSGKVKIRC